jgi:hypothetical protein
MWQFLELVRWNVDVTIYHHLCMREPNPIQPNL